MAPTFVKEIKRAFRKLNPLYLKVKQEVPFPEVTHKLFSQFYNVGRRDFVVSSIYLSQWIDYLVLAVLVINRRV